MGGPGGGGNFASGKDSIARQYFADYVMAVDVPELHLVLKVGHGHATLVPLSLQGRINHETD